MLSSSLTIPALREIEDYARTKLKDWIEFKVFKLVPINSVSVRNTEKPFMNANQGSSCLYAKYASAYQNFPTLM